MDPKKSLSLVAALGFAASLACAPALAQEEQVMPEQEQQMPEEKALGEIEFGKIDQNNDGQVTREEWLEESSEESFRQADENGDGVVTEDELQKAAEEEQQGQEEQPQ